jgi:hypothetical protein
MFVTENKDLFGPKWIFNFPTKKHWRNPSKIEWIRGGGVDPGPMDLIWFVSDYREKSAYYEPALNLVTSVIDGFKSAFGLELLATIDWHKS